MADSLAGPIDFTVPVQWGTSHPTLNCVTTPTYGGQWRLSNGGKYLFDLVVVSNVTTPVVEVQDKLQADDLGRIGAYPSWAAARFAPRHLTHHLGLRRGGSVASVADGRAVRHGNSSRRRVGAEDISLTSAPVRRWSEHSGTRAGTDRRDMLMGNALPPPVRARPHRDVALKNRIIKAPQHTGLANPDGSITERMLRYYKEVAQGGCAMVVVEYAWVDDLYSRASPCQLGISRMDHLPGLSLLCDTIKAQGAMAGIQISHAGRQRFILEQPKAASDVPWPEITAMGCPIPIPLTIEEIREIIKAFGRAAKRAQMAGFDLVEIHACHGYLISNFLSPYSNKRTDWYGGDFENRIRLLMEISQRDQGPGGAGLSGGLPLERHRLRAGRLRHRRDRGVGQAARDPGRGRHPHVGRHPSHNHPRSQPHGHVSGSQRLVRRSGEEGAVDPGDRFGLHQPARACREHPGRGQGRFHRPGAPALGRPAVAAQGQGRPPGGHPAMHPL